MLNAKFFSFLSFEQYMIEQGALTINGIQDIAATTVQKCWRGYTVRKAFQDKKNLFLRHEQLKGQKRASAARTGDIFGNQSPYSVSPGSASPRYFKCRWKRLIKTNRRSCYQRNDNLKLFMCRPLK